MSHERSLGYKRIKLTKPVLKRSIAIIGVAAICFMASMAITGGLNDDDENLANPVTTEQLVDVTNISDGVYVGSAEGFRGAMTVEVTVASGMISKIEVVNHVDDKKWFDKANNVITTKIIESQSINVDTVSGATYSSVGITNAVQNALDTAK